MLLAMPQDENASTPGLRHNLKNLPPIQTAVDNAPQPSRWRRSRFVAPAPEHKASPAPSKLENRKSAMSLFNLFSRPKVEKARGHHEAGLPTIHDVPGHGQSEPTTALSSVTATAPPKALSARTPTARSHRTSFSRRSRTFSNTSSDWDPPALFQAYPQAIKHATLQASNVSVEAIMKMQHHRRQYNLLQEKLESKLDLSSAIAEDDGDAEAKRRDRREKRMSVSSMMGGPDLTEKVYVLATSGYLLQYSGEGSSDRLPERVLQLGKDSAAFVCDLIPGKHWVLQISQATNDDGTMTTQQPPKSFLSRLRMQGPAVRKVATSMLLVFENPTEMGEWLTALRLEIDILAGRKSRADAEREVQEAKDKRLSKISNNRYQMQRDSSRFDVDRSSVSTPVGSPIPDGPEWPVASGKLPRKTSDATTSSKFASRGQSMEAPSMATTANSYAGTQLDQLREGSRLSVMSSRTAGTSPGSSIYPPSPSRDTYTNEEGRHSPTALRSSSMSPSGSSRRRSMPVQQLPPTSESRDSTDSTPRTQRHSTITGTSPATQYQQIPVSIPAPALNNHMSFSRPFGSNNQSFNPPPGIRSFSAPAIKSSPLHTGPQPPMPSQEPAELSSHFSFTLSAFPHPNRQNPTSNPGFRPVPIRSNPTPGIPPRRVPSFGPMLPINPTPPLPRSSPQPQLQHPPTFSTGTGQLQPPQGPAPQLRRPPSMQIRRDPAAFLSTRRPMGVSSQTRSRSRSPSGTSAAGAPTLGALSFAQSAPVSRRPSAAEVLPGPLASGPRQTVRTRQSMPVMGLPPPAPPPSMPLPAPPPNAPLPPLPIEANEKPASIV